MSGLASVVLAAGHGTRMRSALPKVLHPVGCRPMLHHVMATASALGAARQVVVIGSQAPEVGEAARAFAASALVAVQDPPRGTADAVRVALPGLEDFDGIVLILYADTPLVTAGTLQKLIGAVDAGAAIAVLGFEPVTPGAYGRLVLGPGGDLVRIVEAKDANPAELALRLCNSGVMAVGASALRTFIPRIGNDNAKGEFYLTDLVALIRADGGRAVVVNGDEDEVFGVNDRAELAEAESLFQRRRRDSLMRAGVTMLDPSTVYLAYDTVCAEDVVIGPGVVFGPGVALGRGVRIEAYSHLEGARVADGAVIGPFARLRPGTEIGVGARIGNFVETKKARLGPGAKANHLSYLGDADIGAAANIGAGTITCNYDGYNKFETRIGAGAFIGSNTSLIAPVRIGDGAMIGSGSVISDDVAPDALALGRGQQIEKPGWALSFRQRHGAKPV